MTATRHVNPIAAVAVIAALSIAGSYVWAADPTPTMPAAPTQEMREKVALAHEQMAACLRSDQSIAVCRQAMMQSCHDMGGQACGMGMMGGQRPMKRASGMPPSPPAPTQ
jgi:hypothetical protein